MADELYEEEAIENLIIVGVPYKNVKDRRNKYHPDGSQHHCLHSIFSARISPLHR